MKQVYQLLRNNRLSGPYTLDELKKQQLTASDLVWAEGKSKAWTAPSEFGELEKAPHARKRTTSPAAAPAFKKEASSGRRQQPVLPGQVPVSGPAPQPATLSLEQQAEALRARALSYTPVQFYSTAINPPSEAYPVTADEEEGIRLVIHKAEGGVTLSQLALAGLLTAVVAAGWYGSWMPVRSKPDTVNATALPARFTEEVIPVVKAQPVAAQVSTPPEQETGALAALPVKKRATSVAARKGTATGEWNKKESKELSDASLTPAAGTEVPATPAPPPPTLAEKGVTDVQPAAAEAIQPEGAAKKKTLGQAIKNLFRKKKKGEALSSEEAAARGN